MFGIKPKILGGDPEDLANKKILTRKKHIELVRYWNRTIKRIREQSSQQSKDYDKQNPLENQF